MSDEEAPDGNDDPEYVWVQRSQQNRKRISQGAEVHHTKKDCQEGQLRPLKVKLEELDTDRYPICSRCSGELDRREKQGISVSTLLDRVDKDTPISELYEAVEKEREKDRKEKAAAASNEGSEGTEKTTQTTLDAQSASGTAPDDPATAAGGGR